MSVIVDVNVVVVVVAAVGVVVEVDGVSFCAEMDTLVEGTKVLLTVVLVVSAVGVVRAVVSAVGVVRAVVSESEQRND